MQYLRVKNWKEFQHYNDRSPPWIKLHRKVLDDYDMSCLQDASKLHLILIWVLASQLDNRIPNDPMWVTKKIGVNSKVNIKELIDKGFLVVEQDASTTIAECSPETEAEKETEEELVKKARPKLTLEELSLDHNAEWLAEKRTQGQYLDHDEAFILEYFKNYCKSKGKRYADHLAGYRNAFEWDSCQPRPGRSSGKRSGKVGYQPPSKTTDSLAALNAAGNRNGAGGPVEPDPLRGDDFDIGHSPRAIARGT